MPLRLLKDIFSIPWGWGGRDTNKVESFNTGFAAYRKKLYPTCKKMLQNLQTYVQYNYSQTHATQ